MRYSIQNLIIFFAFLPALLAAVIGLLQFKQLEKPLKYLSYLIFFAVVTEVVSRILWIQHIPNLFLWPLYTTVEFVLLAWVYRLTLENRFIGRWIPLMIVLFLVYATFEITFLSRFKFNSFQRLIESLCVIFFALSYFYKIMKEAAILYLERVPMFWVSAGLIIYFSGNVFVFIFSNYILSYSLKTNMQVWTIHAILNTILYLAYSLALWICPKK